MKLGERWQLSLYGFSFEFLNFEFCVCYERPLCTIEGGWKGNGHIAFALSLFNSRLTVDYQLNS